MAFTFSHHQQCAFWGNRGYSCLVCSNIKQDSDEPGLASSHMAIKRERKECRKFSSCEEWSGWMGEAEGCSQCCEQVPGFYLPLSPSPPSLTGGCHQSINLLLHPPSLHPSLPIFLSLLFSFSHSVFQNIHSQREIQSYSDLENRSWFLEGATRYLQS